MMRYMMPAEDYRVFSARAEHRMITVERPETGDAVIGSEGKPDIRIKVCSTAPLSVGGETFYLSRIAYRTFSVKGEA